jgi:DNA invertase Pin-like site-specific DNA recombinase
MAWTVANCYMDRAVSDGSLVRPGMHALLSDAQAGRLDVIVAEATDRVSRDQDGILSPLLPRYRFQ